MQMPAAAAMAPCHSLTGAERVNELQETILIAGRLRRVSRTMHEVVPDSNAQSPRIVPGVAGRARTRVRHRVSRRQNSGSQSVPGPPGPRRGGRDGAPAWSAARTATATSCAVSASTTMFRRSSTRRTTCPARGRASCGPMAGSVTPGTVEETGTWWIDRHAGFTTRFSTPSAPDRGARRPEVDHRENRFSTGRIRVRTTRGP